MDSSPNQPPSRIIDELVAYLRAEENNDAVPVSASHDEVSQISREVGQLYEKLRFAIDNKEEQFFRRHAIRRTLRRKSLFTNNTEKIFNTLILDLVRGGYLERTYVPDTHRTQALSAITSFVHLSELIRAHHDITRAKHYRRFLLDVVAGGIEDALYNTTREEGVVMVMARTAEGAVRSTELDALSGEMRRMFFYVASWRSLFSGDASLLRYKLWMLYAQDWDQKSPEALAQLASTIPNIVHEIEHIIDHPLGRRLLPKLHDIGIGCMLLYDAVCEYGAGVGVVISDKEHFVSRVRAYIEKRYRDDLVRARRRSMRAIAYILATKSLIALGVESAYVMLLKQPLNYIALTVNLTTHPTLLFLLSGGLTKPSAKNTERAVEMVKQIVEGKNLNPIYLPLDRKGLLFDIALGIYVAVLFVSILGIVYALSHIGFHVVDIVLFVFFLLLVLYFGFRIRMGAFRMRFSHTKEGIIRTTIELLILPLVSLGRYMSLRFENLNVIAVFLDFIIEAPLRLVLRFFDAFSSFVSERRDQIYSS